MSEKERVDPRVKRTRALLQSALTDLLRQKPLRKIQVKEIAAHAEVSRYAFYAHFDTKEELLFSYIDDIFATINQKLQESASQPDQFAAKTLIMLMFQLWEEQIEALQWIMQVENKDLLLARFRSHIAILWSSVEAHPDTHPAEYLKRDPEYAIDFVAGGSYMLLRRWTKEKPRLSAEEMGSLVFEFIVGMGIIN